MKLNYRPEIDGLRGLSVLAVVIYHLDIKLNNFYLFGSGFLGVDVFFVISGFLITSIILKELQTTGSFSFLYFFERRIRRILPVLLTILIFSWIVSWFVLIPTYLVDFSKSIISSILFYSNFLFYFLEIDYWAVNNSIKPLLHTWSLAVEEQFYLIFPIILFIFYKKKNKIIYLLFFLFLLSFFSSLFYNFTNPSYNFYMLQTRGWELISGSIVAYLNLQDKKTINKHLSSLLAFFSLMIILICLVCFPKNYEYIYIIRIFLIVSTCLVIYFCTEQNVTKRLLSAKILVFIGLISYSFYLWHYPIFSFAQLNNFFSTFFYKIIFLITSTIISIISYKIIEKPFRNKKNSFKIIIFIICFFSIMLLVFSKISINKNGFDKREKFLNNLGLKIDNYVLDQNYYIQNHLYEFSKKYTPSNFKTSGKRKKILVVGNSFANNFFQILNSVDNINKNYDIDLISPKNRIDKTRYEIRCFKEFLSKNTTYCDNLKFNFTDNIKEQFNLSEIVIIVSRWDGGFDDIKVLDDVVKILKNKNKKVILIDNPVILKLFTSNSLNLFDYYVFQKGLLPNKDEISSLEKDFFKYVFNESNNMNVKIINEKIKLIAQKYDVKFLEQRDFLCEKKLKICHLVDDETNKIFIDDVHITNEGVKYLGKLIYEKKWFKLP